MENPIVAWVGLAALLLLCLPFSGTRMLILEVYGWALRLGLLALLAGAGVLWFRPELLPAEVGHTLNTVPTLKNLLPPSESRMFGVAVATFLSLVLLPVLAVLDVTRKLAGSRFYRLCRMADSARLVPSTSAAPVAAATQHAAEVRRPAEPAHGQKRTARQAAADAMADASSRKPFRVADDLP
jgi:hypothetical protein